jgi:hypothetical protein
MMVEDDAGSRGEASKDEAQSEVEKRTDWKQILTGDET